MNNEEFNQFIENINKITGPDVQSGLYASFLDKFASQVSINKKGIATITLKLDTNSLNDSKKDGIDIRSIVNPQKAVDNDLVPMLLFVDKKQLHTWLKKFKI